MTAIQLIESLLDTDWEVSVTGRTNDVPKPEIVAEKAIQQADLKTTDYAKVMDGGDVEMDPLGFGFTHKRVSATVTVQLRTMDRRLDGARIDGRVRMFGERDGLNEPERHGGLVGETVRILDGRRKGLAEFGLLVAGPVRDLSGQFGKQYYRADVDVALLDPASEIDVSV